MGLDRSSLGILLQLSNNNYTSTGWWQTVAIGEDIKEDLYTLQEAATTAALAHETATMPPTKP
jgi:hypothetical protein